MAEQREIASLRVLEVRGVILRRVTEVERIAHSVVALSHNDPAIILQCLEELERLQDAARNLDEGVYRLKKAAGEEEG